MKTDIEFNCYQYTDGSNDTFTIFQFFPGGNWDEDKLTVEEAFKKYPVEQFNWIYEE